MNYSVSFLANGNPSGYMCVHENMTFAELAKSFCSNFGLKEDNKPTFSFNSKDIDSESTQTLKELGIPPMAVIQVKTPKPFSLPMMNVNNFNQAGNMGNFQMNNNQMYMGNFGMNAGFYGNMNQGFYGNMNQGFYGNMNNAFMNYQNMNMNMGQNVNNQNMNMNMGQNANNQNANNANGDFLNITFHYKGAPIQIQSTSNVKFCDLYTNKFSVKAGSPSTPPSFYLNNFRIDATETRTLRELNICNNAIINAIDDGKKAPASSSGNASSGNGDFLNITFYYKGAPIQIQSTSNVRFCDLYNNKFIVKAGNPPKPPSFYINNVRIDSTETRTLRELNICNNAKIQADDSNNSNSNSNSNGFLNIIFNCQGKTFTVQATQDTRMCDLSVSFCNKSGNVGQIPTFIVNSRKIESTETKKLKELGIVNQSKIEVVFTSEVVGA